MDTTVTPVSQTGASCALSALPGETPGKAPQIARDIRVKEQFERGSRVTRGGSLMLSTRCRACAARCESHVGVHVYAFEQKHLASCSIEHLAALAAEVIE